MKSTVNERIKELIKTLKLSDRKFSELTGISNTTLSNYFKRGSEPGVNTIVLILTKYPDVSAEWLLLGKGNILKEPETKPGTVTDTTNEIMLKTIIDLSGENAVLKEKLKEIEKERGYQLAAEPVKKYSKH